jgi:hypothetical protein
VLPYVGRGFVTGLVVAALIGGLRVIVEGFHVAELLRDLGVGVGVGTAVGLGWGLLRSLDR